MLREGPKSLLASPMPPLPMPPPLSYSGFSLQWNRDEWNFAPANLTCSLPCPSILRGRLECTAVNMSNTSNGLKTWEIGNSTLFNLSVVPGSDKQLRTGYELRGVYTANLFARHRPFNDREDIWSSFSLTLSSSRSCKRH